MLALKNVYNSKNAFRFIYNWGFFLGVFVWEDMVLISAFNLAIAMLTIIIKDIRIGLLFFLVFWVIRPAGETLYFFMQQFNRPLHAPHNIHWHFKGLKRLFGNISLQKCFILMQVLFQLVMIVAVSLLILLLKNWSTFPAWF